MATLLQTDVSAGPGILQESVRKIRPPLRPHQQRYQQGLDIDQEDPSGKAADAGTRGVDIAESDTGGPSLLRAATVLAGALSRTAAQVAIHPLDTLKTRMQVRLPAPQLRVWRAVMSCPATRPRAVAAWAGAAGVRDLLLGLGASVAGVLPSSALYFAVEPRIRGWLGRVLGADKEAPMCRLAASAAAASLSAFIRVPADVIKHRVQIVIQFTVYRQLKDMMERRNADGGGGGAAAAATVSAPMLAAAAEHLVLGGAAGAVATLATTPLDVIKTQLQCGSATSVPAAVAQVLRASGPAGLFGGLTPRLLQATLCSALFFMCFEASKAHLGGFDATAAPAGTQMQPPAVAATAAVALTPEAAPVLRPLAHGCLMPPPLLPSASLWQRRSEWPWRSDGVDGRSGGAAATTAAASTHCWSGGRPRGTGGALTPVAIYAYAYAGAAAPAAAIHR
ncbi:mitochondrial substrate carrier [Volvox carteri f. nagariensis]|uniref:Mitochondrial substrate carrier n=1 Tax=Volvox carteri f. nagariensis TaxID=3068 RepID=D8U993_VOLCA|nr:mitochondrial substrate carrier [Volvox carteri f. nagariensis]EFJ43714.1 mitochondrial substrate carrier [Volvox carteri f. nagariensis]|eukprot:XP_002955195.1 mitochondrial substrate carrier [Volvox carteri f. nagariensis]